MNIVSFLNARGLSASYALQELFEGFGYSVAIFIVTILLSVPFGFIIAFMSMSKKKFIKMPTRGFIWIIRGVPLMLQIIVIFIVPGIILQRQVFSNSKFSLFLAATIAFSINYACYLSEIFRSGIQSVSKGQNEAGQVLGLSKYTIFKKVVLLQAVKKIMPPFSNEMMTLIKDTALANVIGMSEIIFMANKLTRNYGAIWPLFAAGLFYLVFVGLLTICFGKIEKKLSYFRG